MAYEDATRLLNLVLKLADDSMTQKDIAKELTGHGKNIRTAQRACKFMREFFELDTSTNNHNKKTFKIRNDHYVYKILTEARKDLRPEHISALQLAIKKLERENINAPIAELVELEQLLERWIKTKDNFNAFDVDTEALLMAQGLANRPGPTEAIDHKTFETLRNAILSCNKVRLTYYSKNKNETYEKMDVCPYGFLYGSRAYLVCFNAFSVKDGDDGMRNLLIANIKKIEQLDESFVIQEGFDINEYASQSFGTYRNKPRTFKWRFTPKAAKDAKDFIFHPDQKAHTEEDGSLVVEFTAMADMDICWHLFRWGDGVEILEPADIKAKYITMLEQALKKAKSG